MEYDIIIVGAGATGLLAAKELSQAGKSVLVLEARERIGGRINSLYIDGFRQTVETGAEFVHGNLPITLQLLKEAGIKYLPLAGALLQVKGDKVNESDDFVEHNSELNKRIDSLKEDMSVADFLNEHLKEEKFASLRKSIQRFIEGYEAAELRKASVMGMKGDITGEGEEEDQYRIVGGYTKLMNYLMDKAELKGGKIFLNAAVKKIEWQKDNVSVTTANKKTYIAPKLLVTIPLGVLQSNSEAKPQFVPALDNIDKSMQQLGYGHVIKVIFQFNKGIWKKTDKTDGEAPGFILSDKRIPTWWTQLPGDADHVTGWLGGPKSIELSQKSQQEIIQISLESLADILSVTVLDLQKEILATYISNWSSDPYAMGAYAYAVVNDSNAIETISRPIDNTIFFAGEHLYEGRWKGTVEAAFQNSLLVVKEVLNSFIT